ncbi:glycosyl transferase [Virgibacillus indicus]|uniref:Glycosyl transferase n=1 Tax=Virgibacillus indicus TaxID=2024554 RepID=A0A265NBS7_9BACI|nr:glycosyltransferase [Virgibacillus indicus]OZU89277.1 glycosyl transferase [Virgibacillus indicus]
MKKVLFMLSSMNIGGVEKSFLSLMTAMPKDKYDVTLLLLEKKGGFLKDIPDWIKVEESDWFKQVKPIIMQSPQKTISGYVSKKQFLKIPSFMYSYLLSEKVLKDRYIYYKNVFKAISEYKDEFDIAISYQGPTDIIDYYIANRVNANKKISWVHFDVTKHTINKKLYKKLYKKFDKVFAVSKSGKEKLIEKIPSIKDKTEVFMNIISKQLINEMAEKDINLDEDYKGKKLVTVGRLSREKGQDIAIRVLARLRKNGYEVRWYCIGEGKERTAYEQLIQEYGLKDDFILMGATPNPYPFIKRSDIYVQTSRHEGYCLTLAEARCLNKPIVTTDFTGAKEQVIDGYNGWIVKDEEELYEKTKKLLENRLQRGEFQMNLSKLEIDTSIEINKLLNIG